MKYKNRLLMLSSLFTLLFFSTLLQAAPESYPLVCKGGGDTETNIYNSEDGTTVLFKFKRSTRGASSGVNKGECAWLDRGISRDEPEWLSMSFKPAHSKISIYHKNSRLSSYKVFTWGDRASEAKLKKLLSSIENGNEFHVYAYSHQSRRGGTKTLIMTKFGP